jgi:hypothetical protein
MTTVINNSRVWQVLSDFNNISEVDARNICRDFTLVGLDLPADDFACDHTEMIQGIHESMEMPDIREAMIRGEEEIVISNESTEDPFFYNNKISSEEINEYLVPYTGEFSCIICKDNFSNGVSLSCSQSEKPCCNKYCKECITQWLTKCVSRCPGCRTFCEKVDNHILTSTNSQEYSTPYPKKKIMITVKRK